MSGTPRTAVLALLLALPLAACGGEDDGGAIVPAETTTSSGSSPSSETSATSATTVPTPTTSSGSGAAVDIVVEGGQPVGGAQQLDVALGDEVSIRVTADAADEVHVHGYDLFLETLPGEPVELVFEATIPGQFEVELEGAHVLILELTVA